MPAAIADRSFLLTCANAARSVGIVMSQIADARIEPRPDGRPGWVGRVRFGMAIPEHQAKDVAALLQESIDRGRFRFASGVLGFSCGSSAVTAAVRVHTEMTATVTAVQVSVVFY